MVPDVSNLDFDRRIQNAASLTLTGSVVFNNAFSLQASFDDPQANEKVRVSGIAALSHPSTGA